MGGDQTLREIGFNGTGWSAWINGGGVLTSAPSCLSFGSEEVRCFSATAGNALQEKRKKGAVWGGWASLGGAVKPLRPACTSGATRIDCFAAGTDGRLDHIAFY